MLYEVITVISKQPAGLFHSLAGVFETAEVIVDPAQGIKNMPRRLQGDRTLGHGQRLGQVTSGLGQSVGQEIKCLGMVRINGDDPTDHILSFLRTFETLESHPFFVEQIGIVGVRGQTLVEGRQCTFEIVV